MRSLLYLPWEFELSFFRTFLSEGREDTSVDVENLNSVVVGVGDDDSIRIRDGYVVRVVELSDFRSVGPKFPDERSVGLENLE